VLSKFRTTRCGATRYYVSRKIFAWRAFFPKVKFQFNKPM